MSFPKRAEVVGAEVVGAEVVGAEVSNPRSMHAATTNIINCFDYLLNLLYSCIIIQLMWSYLLSFRLIIND